MTEGDFRRKLEKIRKRFAEADEALNELPAELRNKIQVFHADIQTLQYCIKFGLIGVDELIESVGDIHDEVYGTHDEDEVSIRECKFCGGSPIHKVDGENHCPYCDRYF